MTSIFKDDVKPTKIQLIQIGRVITDTLEQANELNDNLKAFEKEQSKIIEDNTIFVSTKMLQEGLEEVELMIGKAELKESLNKK